MNIENWKKDYEEFEKVTRDFYDGKISVPEYKGFSGGFGSYAQRGGKASMLRLRLPGGRVTKDKLKFITDSIRRYHIDKVHFTTCQTIQLHNLNADAVCSIAVEALEHGIVTRGGGGDFPRNVMVSPLSGVEQGEYFDVSPYAEAAAEYLMTLIKTVKLPRKLKVAFSNSPANRTHATFRDLGFVAREDGTFDVYSAGGLGNNAKMGVLVAEGVEGSKILYYIRAMVDLFTTYGNYENRAKARTRYMQDVLGEKYTEEFRKKLDAVFASGVDMDIPEEKITKAGGHDLASAGTEADGTGDTAAVQSAGKTGDGSTVEGSRIIPQKQEGLYAVEYHPIGGCPAPEKLIEIYDAIKDMEQVELRVAPDETVYIINCTGTEAEKLLTVTDDGAANLFETSVACIGSSICQVGVRDSQKLLATLVAAAREWNFPEGTLPRIHISGCPSSCGTHQIGRIGFRGGMKKVDGKPVSAFVLYVNGKEGEPAQFGEQLGTILEEEIPAFMKALGEKVSASGKDFETWYAENPEQLREIAAPYL